MRYAFSRVPFPKKKAVPEHLESATTSVRFGDVLFHMTDEPRWGGLAKAARESGAVLKSLPHSTPRRRLHMVVQKGRLFQQEHPEVPVLLDKGRYLVVDLDPRRAKKWDPKHRPCYAIRPLPESGVAFDLPAPRTGHRAVLPWVQTLVDRITRAPFEADLRQLVTLPTRFSTSSFYSTAAKSARLQLKQFGFQTRLQTIAVNGGSSFNVIADKAGRGPPPREVVIVGAHLDSINIVGGPAAPAPGADDDGSGSAGVLSIARALKDHAAIHDLRLILFT